MRVAFMAALLVPWAGCGGMCGPTLVSVDIYGRVAAGPSAANITTALDVLVGMGFTRTEDYRTGATSFAASRPTPRDESVFFRGEDGLDDRMIFEYTLWVDQEYSTMEQEQRAFRKQVPEFWSGFNATFGEFLEETGWSMESNPEMSTGGVAVC